MIAIKAYFDGANFVPITPINLRINQSAIITILDDIEIDENKPHKKYIGKLSDENFNEIQEILLETQKVDKNEW